MSTPSVVYLDASALVKLAIRESGSQGLSDYLGPRPIRVTSRVSAVEVRRAVARATGVKNDERVAQVLDAIDLIELDEELAAAAGWLDPVGLRSLDAIHLASAMTIGTQLEAIATYDRRLADAAEKLGIAVASPGGTRGGSRAS